MDSPLQATRRQLAFPAHTSLWPLAMGSSGMRTPRTFAALKRLQLQAKFSAAAAVSGLPLAAALFALGTTALIVLWAQTAYSPHAPRVIPRQASSQHVLPGAGQQQQGSGSGDGANRPEEGRGQGGEGTSKVAQAAPFLSDELPESEGSRKRAPRLSPEEEDRSKAEAVYQVSYPLQARAHGFVYRVSRPLQAHIV